MPSQKGRMAERLGTGLQNPLHRFESGSDLFFLPLNSENLKLTFLGTGTSQGVPVIGCTCDVCKSQDHRDQRLRSSVLIQHNDLNIVIDSGPDFRQQMLRVGINHLSGLVFTHSHKDHIAGMDDVRAFNFIQRKEVQVYCNADTLTALKREFYYVFEEHKYPGVPEIKVNLITENEPFFIEGLQVIPILVWHYKMPVLGFRIGDITYITDANLIPETEKLKIKGSKVLVLNALRHTSHISHFTLEEAISLGHELEIPQVYFTHISHQLGLHQWVTKALPQGMALAYDGLEVVI